MKIDKNVHELGGAGLIFLFAAIVLYALGNIMWLSLAFLGALFEFIGWLLSKNKAW